MERIVPYLISALFLLLMFLLMRLTHFLTDRRASRKILTFGRAAEDTVGALLMTRFGGDAVLHNVYLPYRTKDGIAYTEVDCIAILPAGIVPIEVKSLVGRITNPDGKTWHQSTVTRSGEQKELDFVSPILQNERHMEALIGIFEQERVLPKPRLENMVVFTSNRASFVYVRQKEIFTLSEALEFLDEWAKEGPLDKKQRLAIRRSILQNAVSKRQAIRQNRRIRQNP